MKASKLKIIARLQNMAQGDIMSMINPDTLTRIKNADATPEIRVYIVGHEGVANPNMIGAGARAFQYFKEAIYKLAGRLKEGIQAFNNHAVGTNSHAGRNPIGELIGKATREINGKLSALAAIYIYPEHRGKKLDVASIEADVEYSIDDKGYAQVDEFVDISGIALGDGNLNKPAFPGATLLATMQAFERGRGKQRYSKNGGNEMTPEEIRQAIKDGKLSPSDVFSAAELQADSSVRSIVTKAEQTGYEHHRQKLERQIGKPIDDFIKETDQKIKDLTGKTTELESKLTLTKSGGIIKSLSTDRKLTPKQMAFVEKNMSRFTSTAKTDDELKLEANKFIDGQITEFAETLKLLGIKDDSAVPPSGDKNPDGTPKGTPAGDGQEGSGASEDLQDPKKNDFIPATD